MTAKRDRLRRRFADPEYRHAYCNSFLNTTLAAQIKAIRERQLWTQGQLGEKIGTTQSGVSTLENVNYSRWSVGTLRKMARAFDVALIVRFASFGEMLNEIDGFGEERISPVSFGDDPEFKPEAHPEQASPIKAESRMLTFDPEAGKKYRQAVVTGSAGSESRGAAAGA